MATALTPGTAPERESSDERTGLANQGESALVSERDRLLAAVLALCASAGRVDLSQVVREAATLALSLTGADFAMFVPAEAAGFDLPQVSYQREPSAAPPALPEAVRLSEVLWGGEAVRVDDLGEVSHLAAGQGGLGGETGRGRCDKGGRAAEGGDLCSWVGLPVKARDGDAIGALFVGARDPEVFGAREVELAQALASYLGARFDNLSLSLERAQVAGALQQTLLPPTLPDIPGLQVAARYRPAKAVARVGGDFYDIFEVGEGTWGLMVGDVSGTGPEAAALTGVARYGARAIASGEHSPAELLSQLNDTLLRLRLREKFCTLLYAHLVPCKGKVRAELANGGHPYPFVVRASGEVEQVAVHGTLLGAFDELCVEQREVLLEPGDLMVFYTDGVIEAHGSSGDFFGTEGLVRVLSNSAGASPAQVARAIERAVLEHQEGGARDDVAVIVVRNRGAAS